MYGKHNQVILSCKVQSPTCKVSKFAENGPKTLPAYISVRNPILSYKVCESIVFYFCAVIFCLPYANLFCLTKQLKSTQQTYLIIKNTKYVSVSVIVQSFFTVYMMNMKQSCPSVSLEFDSQQGEKQAVSPSSK
jgi:hypothetical protein